MHVYDAMAEKPKEDVQESDTGSVHGDKKKGTGDEQSAVKTVNGAKNEAEVTELEKSAAPPVDEVGEATTKEGESPAQDEEKDAKSNTGDEQEDEDAEGSKLYKRRALFVNGCLTDALAGAQ